MNYLPKRAAPTGRHQHQREKPKRTEWRWEYIKSGIIFFAALTLALCADGLDAIAIWLIGLFA